MKKSKRGQLSVALVTSNRASWPDHETPLLKTALQDRGVHAELLPWHEKADWSAFDLIVIRSPWDCFIHIEEFLTWLSMVETEAPVLNSVSIIRWVLDKHYLNDLVAQSISVVPTTFVEVGDRPSFPDGKFVIKPAVNGGALKTARYIAPAPPEAYEHIAAIHADGVAAMIQPYLSAVDTLGEHALIFYESGFDHAITKQALLQPEHGFQLVRDIKDVHPRPMPYTPSLNELELAHAAIAAIPDRQNLIAARVDIISSPSGVPVVLELELIGPILFYGHNEGSLDRFAKVIIEKAQADGTLTPF